MKYRLASFAFLIAFAVPGIGLDAAPPIPSDLTVIKFSTPTGVVTFNHRHHAELSFVQCQTCHHEYRGSGAIEGCHVCHKVIKNGDSPTVRDAFHLKCAGCHEYTVQSGQLDHAGPKKTQCKLCHIK